MSDYRADPRYVLSPLDRLIDDRPEAEWDDRVGLVGTMDQVKKSVYDNVVLLLNSKRPLVALPAGRHPLQRSLLAYGLPDFTHLGMETADDQELLRTAIESAIRRFEPRLTRVSVSAPEVVQQSRNLRFQITAVLNVKPAPEILTFDSTLLMPARKFELRGGAWTTS
jgi:type VI secretion system protein ImpF